MFDPQPTNKQLGNQACSRATTCRDRFSEQRRMSFHRFFPLFHTFPMENNQVGVSCNEIRYIPSSRGFKRVLFGAIPKPYWAPQSEATFKTSLQPRGSFAYHRVPSPFKLFQHHWRQKPSWKVMFMKETRSSLASKFVEVRSGAIQSLSHRQDLLSFP